LQVRCEAQAAHQEAAELIEADVNAGNPQGQWQLDVHGLHVSEAIEAVERRLALLEWAAPAGWLAGWLAGYCCCAGCAGCAGCAAGGAAAAAAAAERARSARAA
jgi:hypothetical protein